MKQAILFILITSVIAIIATSAVAQDTPVERKYTMMVVFYNSQTEDVIGYAPYDNNLVIDEDGVQSSTLNMTGVDWNIVSYGLYKYQEIPPKTIEIDGYAIDVPWKLSELNLESPNPEDLPHSQHIAQLTGVDTDRAKPLEVTRRFHGIEYTENCFVSQSVIAMYLNGQIAIGDYVIVSYISETPNQTDYELPIVVDKVYQSWE